MKNLYQGPGHIGIFTADIAESIAFYEKIGGKLLEQSSTAGGATKLALLEFGGYVLEFIERSSEMPIREGSIPHFAVYVNDVDEAAAAIRAAGVDTFITPEKLIMANTFGGLENWFFSGPSGEQIELLHMY